MSLSKGTPGREKPLGATRKIAYGVGAVGDMIGFHGPANLAVPIYTLYLGVSPAAVGIVLAITRVWDAVSDPMMGEISDRATTRWGRRRPFIVGGALAGGLSFALMWHVPPGLSELAYATFLGLALMIFYTAFTVFTVPYHALGYEMTDDYHERTSVMAYRIFFNVIGNVAVGWLLALAKAPIFGDPLTGAKFAGAFAGLLFAGTCVIPGLLIKERTFRKAPNPEPFWRSFLATGKLPPFRVLLVLTTLILITSTLIFSSFLIYINTFYTFGGDLKKAAILQGVITTCFAVANVMSLPLVAKSASRIGKKGVLKWAFSIQAIAGAATWFVIRPEAPYLQIVALVAHQIGFIAFFVMLHSMTADVCDLDEHLHGRRREGMFGAAITWVQKLAVALSVLVGGTTLTALGFNHAPGASQPESVVTGMRVVFTGVLVAQALISLFVLRYYRLDEKSLGQIRLAKATGLRSADAGAN